MADPLSPAARLLLGRLLRSSGPWRVAGLPVDDLPLIEGLVGRGLVERHLGIYRPTAAGRVELTTALPPT